MSLTSTHLLAGGGGDAFGFFRAGINPLACINHSQACIDTIRANFAGVMAENCNVTELEMRKLPRTDVLVASPICTEVSPSGLARRSKQPDLFSDAQDLKWDNLERTRTTALAIVAAAEAKRYPVIVGENVVEFATQWPLFWWWIEGFRLLGYQHQLISLNAAHISGDGFDAAAQDRHRIVFVFWRDGIRMPQISPRPESMCRTCGPVKGVQAFKKPGSRGIGKYGARAGQYVYVCPTSKCPEVVDPIVRPMAGLMEDSDNWVPVADGNKPGTRAKIAAGIKEFGGDPFLVTLRQNVRNRPLDQPLTAVNAEGNHHLWIRPQGPHVGDALKRLITPREQARAQEFPDDYVFCGDDQDVTRMAGNAVPVNVAQFMAGHVLTALGGSPS